MTLCRGRVILGDQSMSDLPTMMAPDPSRTTAEGRMVPRPIVDASLRASELLAAARQEADDIRKKAESTRQQILDQMRRDAFDKAAAELATARLALAARESQADENALERSIVIGRLLAERVVGECLSLQPETVALLARDAMRQLWRANQVTIQAHPEDIAVIDAARAQLGVPPERIALEVDPTLSRGSLRILSDMGNVEANLSVQLDRLTDTIRREILG